MLKITIAAAARTPLYLPLYVVASNKFLPAHKQYEIKIIEPEDKTINGDRWAAEQVADGKATFAVCDPLAAKEVGSASVVASLVGRAAFWIVSRVAVHHPDQLDEVARIVTYPKHMTGYNVAHFLASTAKSRISVHDRPIDSELDELLTPKTSGKATVSLTPNLISANRLLRKHPKEGLRISPAWELHSTLWSFMLTGLLTHQDAVAQKYDLVTDLIAGLSKASAMVSLNSQLATQILVDYYHKTDPEATSPLSAEEAEVVVGQIQDTRIHPPTPFPDLTSWHNAKSVRTRSSKVTNTRTADNSYRDFVRGRSAIEVERRFLGTLIKYSEGELHNDLIVSLQRLHYFSLAEMRVVGSYYRYNVQARNTLKDVLDRMRRALNAPATDSRANFLLWGESSVGKSYLIEQFADQNKNAFEFVQINVGKDSKETVKSTLDSLESTKGRRLCLIDEIDSKNSTSWSYDLVFPRLDLRTKGQEVVFVFTGSTTNSAEALMEHIAKDYKNRKGADLETRIPVDGRISIPPPVLEDRIVVAAGQLLDKARTRGKDINGIERFAVYYLYLTKGLGKPRHLSDLVSDIVDRVSPGRTLVKFDDLFDEADREKRNTFFFQHISAFEALRDAYVSLSE